MSGDMHMLARLRAHQGNCRIFIQPGVCDCGHALRCEAANQIELLTTKLHSVQAERDEWKRYADSGLESYAKDQAEITKLQSRLDSGRQIVNEMAKQPLISEMQDDPDDGDYETAYQTFIIKARELLHVLYATDVESLCPHGWAEHCVHCDGDAETVSERRRPCESFDGDTGSCTKCGFFFEEHHVPMSRDSEGQPES